MFMLLIATIVVSLWMIHMGYVQPPIPYPAVNSWVHLTPEDVLPWRPRPMEGAFTTNTRLQAVRLFEGDIEGSESVIVSPEGQATMLSKYGGVFQAAERPDGTFELNRTAKAWLGAGRPLGAGFDAHGNLVVCDAFKGLLMLEKDTNRVVLLANRVSKNSKLDPGAPIMYANDLDVAKDGSIYFTSSVDITLHRNAHHDSGWTHVDSLAGRGGFWDTVKGWGYGHCQGLPQGKVYRYDPVTKEAHLLATGFWFSNGIAVSAHDDFLVVSETDRLRLVRYWLKGPKAGKSEVMIDHLPGTPDGLARAPDGNFWVALLAKVPTFTKVFHWPIIRAILPLMDERIRPAPREWGAVFKVSPEGKVLEFLEDPQLPAGQFPTAYRISSAHEHNGKLWLGALVANFVALVDLSTVPPKVPEVPVSWRPPVACVTPPCDRVSKEFH